MRKIGGIFNGTGATVYLCIGVIPDKFKIRALEDGDLAYLEWDRNMTRVAEVLEGVVNAIGTTYIDPTALTIGTGIVPYKGGDLLTTSNQTSVTYGEGVYLGWDQKDYRVKPGDGGDSVSDLIDTWTLDTSANRTGHFNEDVTGTYIGEGSQIMIDGVWYTVIAVTAGQGEAADEVTLSQAAPNGSVQCITGKYGLKPLAVGSVTPKGIKLLATTLVNVNDEMQGFEAEMWDN